jgi:RNA polymerase sigma factor (sigma-70 family)
MTQELDQQNYRRAFEQLFGSDNEAIDVSYRKLREELSRFFRWRRSDLLIEDELVDEVMMRVLRKLAEGSEIQNVKAYVFGVARHVAHESMKKRRLLSLDADFVQGQPSDNTLAVPLWDPAPQIEELEHAERVRLLRECINELRPEDQRLLTSYYLAEKQEREKLKGQSARLANNLRVKVFRIRKHLEIELRRKLYGLKKDEPVTGG